MRTAFLATAALLATVPAIAMSGNWYTAQAKQEVRSCLQTADEPGWDITSSAHVVSTCFAGGQITQVDFAKEIRCLPNQPCARVAATLVASVQFGCEDEVLWAECYVDGSCTYDGAVYAVGESFPATDECNTCYCGEDGLVACTRIGCL